MIDLASCYPHVPLQDALLRNALASAIASGSYSSYGPVGGRPETLRILGPVLLGAGSSGRSAALTPTGQSALAVVFSALCTRPAVKVALEDRTFPYAKEVLRRLGAQLMPIPSDADGLLPEPLEHAAKDGASILYTMPAVHNPTGASMSQERRKEIAVLAERFQMRIVEDCAYSFLDDRSPPTLASLVPQRTFQVFSLSKIVSLALRMGALTAPTDDMPRISRAIGAWGAIANPLMAEAAARMVGNDDVPTLIAAKIEEGRRRQEHALGILGQRTAASSAWHILIATPPEITGSMFAAAAAAKGVSLLPGSLFRADDVDENTFRLSLGGEEDCGKLQAGIEIVAELLARC